jgi:hypothetical protein
MTDLHGCEVDVFGDFKLLVEPADEFLEQQVVLQRLLLEREQTLLESLQKTYASDDL